MGADAAGAVGRRTGEVSGGERGRLSRRVGAVAPVLPRATRRSRRGGGPVEDGLRLLAELSRLTGVLHLARSSAAQAEAEGYMRQALEVARRQEAKSLELRAAMSLSRLWQQQGKPEEAHELLAPVYGWFTEGFDTADLQEAKALLDAWS